MSFRIEEKLSINFNQIFEFKKWLNCQGFKKLYEDRIVRSLYFENQTICKYHLITFHLYIYP